MKARKVGDATSKSWNGKQLSAALRAGVERAQLITCEAICSHVIEFCLPPPAQPNTQHTCSRGSLLPAGKELPTNAHLCGGPKCALSRTRIPQHVRLQTGLPSLPKRESLTRFDLPCIAVSFSWTLFSLLWSHTVMSHCDFLRSSVPFPLTLLKYLVSVSAFHSLPISPWLSDALWSLCEGTACRSNPRSSPACLQRPPSWSRLCLSKNRVTKGENYWSLLQVFPKVWGLFLLAPWLPRKFKL